MRPIELILIAVIALFLMLSFQRKAKRAYWISWLPLVGLLLTLLHFVIEGYRWQMTAVYGLVLLSSISSLLHMRPRRKKPSASSHGVARRLGSIGISVLGLVLVTISGVLAAGVPVVKLPTPPGDEHVGTTFYHVVDHKREEVATEDPSDIRSLWVQVWYPAHSEHKGPRAELIAEPERTMPVFMADAGMPPFMAGHVRLHRTNSLIDAPLKEGTETYPVIIYSHGYTGPLGSNTQIMEALASSGYVVFSIAHTYETMISRRQDGSWQTMADPNARALRSRFASRDTTAYLQSVQLIDAMKAPHSLETFALTMPSLDERVTMDSLSMLVSAMPRERLAVWAADQAFVLDEVERMQSGKTASIFEGRLNLDAVGTMGASFGGATAALMNQTDPRTKASLNIDGGQFGTLVEGTMDKPHMMLYTASENVNEVRFNDFAYLGNAKPYVRVTVKGATHSDIGDPLDDSFLVRALGVTQRGPIGATRMNEVMVAYVLAFFDEYLQNEAQPLLTGRPDFDEVDFRRYD